MKKREDNMNKNSVKAEFLGWQLDSAGEKLFPLFNIIGDHPKACSTVGVDTLKSLGIEVPKYQ
jgi:hypothetical protein